MTPYFSSGGITLYHAHNREVEVEATVEFLFSDPYYGIDYKSTHNSFYRKSRGAWDAAVRDDDFGSIVGDDGPFDPAPWLGYPKVALFGGNYFADKLPPSKCWIIWDKKLGQPDDGADCELVWTNLARPSRIFSHLWRGIVRAGEENVSRSPKLHPHQKPVALLRDIIVYSQSTGVIYDPFVGSGSTLCAAYDLGLEAVGVEIEEEHCETAAVRLEARTRQGRLAL